MNSFEMKNGKLNHYVNGELRAVIEPENIDAYREFQPECPTLEKLTKPAE